MLSSRNSKAKASLKFFAFFAFVFVFDAFPFAAELPDYPVYVAQLPNLNDYTIFANSGWDGNWYVGYNTCWIKKLPPITPGSYARAYLGARLGRMKLIAAPGAKSWEKKPVPGSIYMAIASTMAWTPEQSHELVTTADIPTEGDLENPIEKTGESEWFWTEIPLDQVHLSGENYVALWSPTPELLTISSSPVLAAGWGGKEVNTWVSHDIRGQAPRDAKKTGAVPISYFQPAIALKLIPTGPPHSIQVQIVSWRPSSVDHPKPVVAARIAGDSIVKSWVEYSRATGDTWKRLGSFQWKAPYIFSVDQTALPSGRDRLRVAASNIWEEQAFSAPFNIEVGSTVPPAHKK